MCELGEFYCCDQSVFVFNYIFTITLWEFGCFIESDEVKNEVMREMC